MRRIGNRAVAAGIVVLVAADWLTKFWVQNRLHEGAHRVVVDGWLWLSHHRNPGISWSLLRDLPDPWRVPLLSALALAAMAAVFSILRGARDGWTRAGAALVLAGAAGNLGDRLQNGTVTDFIAVAYFPYVFNVADMAITAGAVLLAARMLVEGRRDEPTAPTPA